MTKPNRIPPAETVLQDIATGMKKADLAKHYGVHIDSLSAAFRRYGITMPDTEKRNSLDLLNLDQVNADLKAGLKMKQIDRKYDLTDGTAQRFCHAHGLIPRIEGIDILPDRVVMRRRYTAKKDGGAAYMAVSLPPISYYVAALKETRI